VMGLVALQALVARWRLTSKRLGIAPGAT